MQRFRSVFALVALSGLFAAALVAHDQQIFRRLLATREMERLYGGGICAVGEERVHCDCVVASILCCAGENGLDDDCYGAGTYCENCSQGDVQKACRAPDTHNKFCNLSVNSVDCGLQFAGTCLGSGEKCGPVPRCVATDPTSIGTCGEPIDACNESDE
jgi:hypothetical protein